jgi:hypothetical protein
MDYLGVVTTFAGSLTGTSGKVDGNATSALFNFPLSMALDGRGNMYVVEYGNHDLRMINSAGDVSTVAGSGAYGYVYGYGTNAKLSAPSDMVMDANGTLYIADTDNNAIRRVILR